MFRHGCQKMKSNIPRNPIVSFASTAQQHAECRCRLQGSWNLRPCYRNLRFKLRAHHAFSKGRIEDRIEADGDKMMSSLFSRAGARGHALFPKDVHITSFISSSSSFHFRPFTLTLTLPTYNTIYFLTI